jgi:hypothetical protein
MKWCIRRTEMNVSKDGSIRVRNRQTASVKSRTAKVTTSTAPWDKSEEAEFTAAWDRHRQRFNTNTSVSDHQRSEPTSTKTEGIKEN